MWLDISHFQLFNRRYSLYIPPCNDITKHNQGITKINITSCQAKPKAFTFFYSTINQQKKNGR